MPSASRPPRRTVVAGLFSLSAFLLAMGFGFNAWGVAPARQFERQNIDMEAHVVARLVESRTSGVFAGGGLLGLGSEDGLPIDWWNVPIEEQFEAYRDGGSFERYEVYPSQPGFQGIAFSLVDRIVSLPPETTLRLLRIGTALLSGIALGLVVTWFYVEMGGTVALVVLLSTLVSPWLTVFGGKLFWVLWAFFVPMLAVMYGLREARRPDGDVLVRLAWLAMVGMLVKTLFTGYEFITAVLVATVVPVAYYVVRRGWSLRETRGALLTTVAAAGAAIAVSLGVLLLQNTIALGTAEAGVEHILDAMRKRTHADPGAYPPGMGLEARTADVLVAYLKGVWLDLNRFVEAPGAFVGWYLFRLRFAYLVAGFGLGSLWLYLLDRRDPAERRTSLALLAATWLALLAPVSWFVIFKAHSAVHVGMNQIVWHLPFTLFGFAVLGRLGERVARRLAHRERAAEIPA